MSDIVSISYMCPMRGRTRGRTQTPSNRAASCMLTQRWWKTDYMPQNSTCKARDWSVMFANSNKGLSVT